MISNKTKLHTKQNHIRTIKMQKVSVTNSAVAAQLWAPPKRLQGPPNGD